MYKTGTIDLDKKNLIHSKLDVWLEGIKESDRTVHLFKEIITNAVESNSDRSQLKIQLGLDLRSEYVFSVEDNGLGIPSKFAMSFITDLFTSNKVKDGKVTGMNLKLVHYLSSKFKIITRPQNTDEVITYTKDNDNYTFECQSSNDSDESGTLVLFTIDPKIIDPLTQDISWLNVIR